MIKILFTALCCVVLLFNVVPAVATEAEASEYLPLYELAEEKGFYLGTVMNYYTLFDIGQQNLISGDFNSVTFANEAKAYSLLNQSLCQRSSDGMPKMNFQSADKMMTWAQENGLKVRGHVLVWDAYMPDWFFRKFYMNSTPYVDEETMRARVNSYIEQVITHFEEKFPGVIYCWDVVNEGVGDSAADWDESDARHIRTIRSGTSNLFKDIIGDDYIEYSFLCARRAAESCGADIKLYYNDYNCFHSEKRDAICALVQSINSYAFDEEGNAITLIDGIGMQGYIGGYGKQEGCLEENDIQLIKTAIETYASLGLEVQITEMAVRCYEEGEEYMEAHGRFYAQLFEMFSQINTETVSPLKAVTIWGLCDCENLPTTDYTWRLNSPWGGLYTSSYEIKPAFKYVYEVLSK